MKLQYKKDYNSLTEIIFPNVLKFPKISVHNKLKFICTKSKECRLLKYSVIKGHGELRLEYPFEFIQDWNFPHLVSIFRNIPKRIFYSLRG
jgi:hypothetical protein